ncbi:ABC transporter transmembrane domain-containing protein [Georgenia muralis]|uniref:ABC-type multidrug transport system fused ATPase/permease subunit n=1 Tax=Georgenia muralis TaxID=154117 RepID=A0A3N4ZPK5_9MICO|nr:ABC transporter ATP-binding protein [Georgenia muralis]RPF27588.1 ABC-type multidrug transport system fused ATPase/permease subunit [Georgenia muralis]
MLRSPQGHPGHPPLTSPLALLGWIAGRQRGVLTGAVVLATVNALAYAAIPFVLGAALDAGLEGGLTRGLVTACVLLLAIGVVQALADALGHIGEIWGWLGSAFRVSRLVGHHVTRTGSAVASDMPTGEVVSTVASDAFHVGNTAELLPRFVGSVIAFLAVAVVLLQYSATLGLAVLVGLPVTMAVLALLVKPLHARQAAHREATGRLTTLGSDTVSGLRVLRGIGGEDVFAARYAAQSQVVRAAGVRVAAVSSLLEALQILLPGLFVAGVVWLGARLALTGEVTAGQLVAFYGATALLAQPLRAATQFITMFTRARVGARKIVKVLAVAPAAGTLAESEAADAGATPAVPVGDGLLVDTTSGVRVRPGRLTALVSARPDEAAELARRLGRLDDAAPEVTVDGVPLRDLPVARVRERIVVADATPQLFTGTLREELDVRDRGDEDALYEALAVADAADVLDSMPERLDGEITEKGRSLSGGQRQRVALARALLTGAETLVLVEPTSAVDAHTEARIAARLRAARHGRTTVVVTASPLVLEHADDVVLLVGGAERTRGRHRDLLARAAAGDPDARAYRDVVARAGGDGENPAELVHAEEAR